ncbi:LysR family transcriptional regulator [Pokkaliibacter plantistimulans]|uniref:LysR family transcriptional regulator n=1 Tax=Proteobacteria bacterium 228 TaxID=2083153 RepID=A0A2S5KMK5_9PROT|nr:LysR substrate-binding domain-containing protein [Pokkaliibacter plantistimulans]PPC76028.1 LysR family transcriptional regulator [Pokkaliibacter plantistimulans]
MDFRQLRYLVEIVASGGFGKAAEQVHLTQPALSKAIRGLEEELDVSLLERGKRGGTIRLTAAGEVVHRHAVQLLEGRQRMVNELHAMRNLQGGELRIGLSPLGSAEMFAPVIALFRSRYPQIDIHLMERGGAELEDALRNGEIELATSLIPSKDDIEWLQIRDDPMMVALPISDPLCAQHSLQLRDLASTPLVTFETTFMLNKLIHDACLASGFTPHEVTQVSQADFGLALVAAGAGAMLLPKLIAERHALPGVVIKPLDSSTLRWQLSLIWRKRATLSFAAQTMLEMIRQRFG